MARNRGSVVKDYRGNRGVVIENADLIRAQLRTLEDKTATKIEVAGMRAMLTPLAKALRASIQASSASPELKRAAKKTVGKRFVKLGTNVGERGGKVGFAVGSTGQRKKKRLSAHERNVYGQGGAKMAKGVGVSAANIHWFVLGTDSRRTSKRPTGRIAPVFEGATDRAQAIGQYEALAAARRKMKRMLDKQMAKTGA